MVEQEINQLPHILTTMLSFIRLKNNSCIQGANRGYWVLISMIMDHYIRMDLRRKEFFGYVNKIAYIDPFSATFSL